MIPRLATAIVREALTRQAAVALLGPRQTGKTTLALELAGERPSVYLDLESPHDRAKLTDLDLYLSAHSDKLVILDEIHRMPELFAPLRGLIDKGRREGLRHGRFLILGSASMDVLKQSSESLAGRIAYVELGPLSVPEIEAGGIPLRELWVRGGFPDSILAESDAASFAWRADFIRTYLERDVPQFGPRIPATTLARFWTMLAHTHGTLLNATKLARSLEISAPTVGRYTDLLVDLLLVRRLLPFHANLGKRLVRAPKVYLRDTGLLHALLGLRTYEDLAGHPISGASWEGLAIENLIAASPASTASYFYRTAAGAEIDLLLQLPGGELWAIEIKSGSAPRLERGFHHAIEDLKPQRAFVVYGGKERFPLAKNVDAINLPQLIDELRRMPR
ncbi:MAG: ATP-binding protein [Planctomycetota bacterium]